MPPTAPYSGGILKIEEGPDGLTIRVFHWKDVLTEDGTGWSVIPPGSLNMDNLLAQMTPRPEFVKSRNCTTITAAVAAIQQYLNAKFTEVTP
jgi:hypothetical protein